MSDSNRENMMQALDRLRAAIGEEKIFLVNDDGGITLSPLAFQKLAEMRLKDQADWREEHREEAERVAAEVLANWTGEFGAPLHGRTSKCGCDWTPTNERSDTNG
jgi:hypothetical protein